MAFYKKIKLKSNGKWYPRSITVGKPVTTMEISQRISKQCTVNPVDVNAVLTALGPVLSDFMAEGCSVRLDGVGTLYYTSNATGNGVDTPEEVSAAQIKGVRVRFIPEKHLNNRSEVKSRALVKKEIHWEEWGQISPAGKRTGEERE